MNPARVKLLIGGGVILAAFGYLFVSGMQSSQVYYLTVSEFEQQANTLSPDAPYRISGRVQPGSVVRSDDGLDLNFAVYDVEKKDAVLPVAYHGVVPDTFMENSEVVVEGTLQRETFTAHTLMAKCPSKYEGLGDEADRLQAHEAAHIPDPLADVSNPGL
ncbi:MAG: cytochrome c maturation protein CcmE [Acidobacteriota bacterium]